VDDFPSPQLLAKLTAAHHAVMAYEAARTIPPVPVSEQLKNLLTTGAAIPTDDYKAALDSIAGVDVLTAHDAVLCPGAPGPAPAGLESTGDPAMSRPWQLLGLPAVAVPGHRDESGLPLGLQLVGRANEETALLATACWLEAALTE
jgi:Asp-tRNA(Asn)/Glu-tRNA(Gln) amidotransferase A subunit family amidase